MARELCKNLTTGCRPSVLSCELCVSLCLCPLLAGPVLAAISQLLRDTRTTQSQPALELCSSLRTKLQRKHCQFIAQRSARAHPAARLQLWVCSCAGAAILRLPNIPHPLFGNGIEFPTTPSTIFHEQFATHWTWESAAVPRERGESTFPSTLWFLN